MSLLRCIPGVLVLAVAAAPCLLSALTAGELRVGGQTLTAPEGFEIERAAGPPLVDRPIVMALDDAGRLYVADSSGSNDKVDKQLVDRPHRIVRLEDRDGDGNYETSTVFADRMMFPEGILWHGGSIYCGAPPSIWKLTDQDGDGVADARLEWFSGKTLTGCANDLHGPYVGHDGWIYWTKGAFAKQVHERPGKPPFVTRAAHVFRARPDGTGVEAVLTGGMDNPVDVAFSAAGERFLTSTFIQHPGGGKRDGIIHAIYGGVYGKDHDVLDDHPRTGGLMPPLVHLGPAAPCGLEMYESCGPASELDGNLFATLFNMHRVTRHVLEEDGATFRTRDSDFLVSDSTDFHPTDVIEDADGSLLVADTGGWYKICCPTSQLSKPDVLGAIYRVRRAGSRGPADARGSRLPWDTMTSAALVDLLADGRPAVRKRATARLGALAGESVPALARALREGKEAGARTGAVWALTRIRGEAARAAVRAALADASPTVRQAAAHSAGIWRDGAALEALQSFLSAGSPHLARAAAEAIGRIGSRSAVPPLLAALAGKNDRVLEHSLTYALIEIADPVSTAAGLEASAPPVRRAALLALEAMPDGGLSARGIAPFLSSPDPDLRDTAARVAGRHPEWGEELAAFLREKLDAAPPGGPDPATGQLLAQLSRSVAIQELLGSVLRDSGRPEALRLLALGAMARADLKETPPSWASVLARCLAEPAPAIRREAVSTLRSRAPPKEAAPVIRAALIALASDGSMETSLRLDALAALPDSPDPLEPGVFGFLISSLAPGGPALTRSAAAGVLARAALGDEQLAALAGAIGEAGPLEAGRLVPAFERASGEVLGRKLVTALRKSPALPSLRPESLKPIFARFPDEVRREGEELLLGLNEDAPKQRERIDSLLASLGKGDVRRGQAIFNGAKAACSTCHAIGYLGGNAGPDLTKIGQIRTERDLLESLVYPSASFVRSYESMVVVTTAGAAHSGILRKDTPEEVVLLTGLNTEVRIPRADVAEMAPGTVSIMPQGLEQQLTLEELSDLMAFLKATRW